MTNPAATQPAPTATTGAGIYQPALDGLRAIAVVFVVLYHSGAVSGLPGLAPGGFIGVSVFFTLSGYLVTTLLMRQSDTTALSARHFWSRRVKRLAPASLLVVLLTVVLSSTYWPGMQASDAIAGVFGYTNWHVILSGEDALLRTIVGPLGPYWSLAIEEQFYVVLFLIVVLALRTRRPTVTVGVVAAIGWLVSLSFQVAISGPQYRLEFGTVVRSSELFAGCLLAVALHRDAGLLARLQPVTRIGGPAALAAIVALAVWNDYDPPWLLHGGYALVSLVSALLVASLLRPSPMTSALACSPAVIVGRLSYSWYLVHWPVILILNPDRTGLERWPLVGVQVAVSLAVAALLHVAVEQPLRRLQAPARTVFVTWLAASAGITVLALTVL